jgi:tetratricopeptide (TPR) repeat protein
MKKAIAIAALGCASVLAACGGDPETEKREFLRSGRTYFENKQYGEAAVQFQNAIRLDPTFGDAHFSLGEAYLAEGLTRQAFPPFMRAAELMPDNIEAQLTAGQLLFKGGMFDEARDHARSVLQKEPGNLRALMLLGNTLAGLQDLDSAVDVLERALAIDPEKAGVYTNLGVFQLTKGNKVEAEAAFMKAVSVSGESVLSLVGLANFYRSAGRPADAERVLKQAYAKDANDSGVNAALAGLFVETSRLPEAETHLQAVTRISSEAGPRFTLAAFYVSTGRPDPAVKILEALAADPKQFAAASIRLATIDWGQGRMAQAHERLDRVIAADAAHGEALTLKARLLLADGKPEEALTRVQTALVSEPRSAAAHLALGRIYGALSRTDDARKALATALEIEPKSLPVLLELAELNLRRRDVDSAKQFADLAVTNHPRNMLARLTLVRVLMVRGETGIDEHLKALLAQYPGAAPVYSLAGAAALTRQDPGTARRSFERALELRPDSVDALSGILAIELADNRHAEARKRIDAFLAAKPPTVGALFLATGVYGVMKDTAKVETLLEQARTLEPDNPEVHGRLGDFYFSQGRLDEARQAFQQLVTLRPSSVGAISILGALAFAQNNRVEARQLWEQALKIDPTDATAANNLAWLYADSGENLDLAMQLAQTARARFPDSAEVEDTIGWIHYRRGMSMIAVGNFERAVARQPNNPSFHYHLGMALAHRGEDAKARASLEKALALNKDFEGAAEARKALAKLVY